jgi:hypothetical protein
VGLIFVFLIGIIVLLYIGTMLVSFPLAKLTQSGSATNPCRSLPALGYLITGLQPVDDFCLAWPVEAKW